MLSRAGTNKTNYTSALPDRTYSCRLSSRLSTCFVDDIFLNLHSHFEIRPVVPLNTHLPNMEVYPTNYNRPNHNFILYESEAKVN